VFENVSIIPTHFMVEDV